MIDIKNLVLNVIQYMAVRHPGIVVEITIAENLEAITGDRKKVASDIVTLLATKHPEVLIELIQQFAPTVIEQVFADLHKKLDTGSPPRSGMFINPYPNTVSNTISGEPDETDGPAVQGSDLPPASGTGRPSPES